jgi:glutamate-1-semialdehyde 2,1-aminomutase
VVTGFRFAYGGAQEYFGIVPDICTLGKIIGGGFPLAAIAGREKYMRHFDRGLVGDDGFLMQIGTLSGNPVAAAAGVATLKLLKQPDTYAKVFATGSELMAGLARIIKDAGLPAQVIGLPPMFDVVYAEGDLHDYRAVQRGDREMQGRINKRLRESGVLKGESKFYLSIAHDAEDVRHTLAAFADAVKAEGRRAGAAKVDAMARSRPD